MMKRWNTYLLGAALALATATGAWAQGAAKVEGDLEKPLKARQKSPMGKSVMSLSQSDGDQTVEVRIEDGEVVSAKVNGKDVPKDRFRQKDGRVEILGKDGEVIQTFSVGRGDAGAWWGAAPGQGDADVFWRGAQGGQGGPFLFTPGGGMAPPKVMLGINMVAPDEETAEKAGVAPDEVIHISKVLDGLPADKAGLKEGDIVVKIAGKSPATPDLLREALKAKEPGDKIKLTVLREGDEKTLTIELAEYDASKLGVSVMRIEPGEGQGGEFKMWSPDEFKAFEEAQKAYGEAMKNLPRQPQFQRMPGQPGQRGMVFRAFPEGGPGNAQLHERLADLDGRMAEIDRRLGELNERLERLTQKLEKLGQNDRP